jgi:serine/threonine protein phosphatase PrpC
MTEGQKSGQEREWEWCKEEKFPVSNPPQIACQKGSKGFRDTTPNQDNFSLTYFKNGYTLACCFDGHGPFGHIVSNRTVQTVPYYLFKSEEFGNGKADDSISRALTEAFDRAQEDLVVHALENGWDVQASGSTAVAALWKDGKVWTANAGDSRCVIGTVNDKALVFETADHKPDNATEKARIESLGGEVRTQTYPDGWVNHRVFVKGQSFPGLCMSRTFGDVSVKAHGVIATPEVKMTQVPGPDKLPFLVLASDGVWEFMDSPFVVKAMAKKIVAEGPKVSVQRLQREAQKRWKAEEGDYCDDITSVLIQLY